MKVLHICPLWFPIAADAPGGIETFLARLIGSLKELGCSSTLLAVEGSVVEGDVVPGFPVGVREKMTHGSATEYEYYQQHQVRMALDLAPQFDVIHSHVGVGAYILSGIPSIGERVLHTHHTPIYDDMIWHIERHPEMWLSMVSDFQARRLGYPPHCEVIPNGIDVSSFSFSAEPGEGLFFIGRIEHVKGPDLAVNVARTLGL
ncbi:MAG: hypothetical protein QOD99_3097, partial [Chthoniobacter sp.]|nr:hypothetical protein [Chthoniobacter sp.]